MSFLNRIVLLVLLLLPVAASRAQVLTPTKLSVALSQPAAKVGEEVDLIVNARMDDTWHLYATDFDPDLGPTAFTFTFTKSPAYELVGKPKSINSKHEYDDVFKGEVAYFVKTGQIRQRIRVLQPGPLSIKADVEYQTCTDTDGRCIPGSETLTFGTITVSGVAAKPTGAVTPPGAGPATATAAAPAPAASPETSAATTLGAADADSAASSLTAPAAAENAAPPASETIAAAAPAALAAAEPQSAQPVLGLWEYLVLAFGAGLLAVIMPCVYPMLPMTVSYFTNTSGSRGQSIAKAVVYALSIIAIYTSVGVLLSVLFGADAGNVISSHWLPNVLSFVIFILFGLSFLGLFEINAPSALVNSVDKQADKGGWSGLFFMAATLVLVSFSCTVPFVGSVAIASANGELLRPTLGMLSFSLAFAFPFLLFALFPSWLKSLPRSGGWLNTFKVTLGFLELALAFKFLSSADLSYHWHLLPRGLFLSIWAVLAALLGFYLLGKIRLPHDDETSRVSVPRLLLAGVVFTFFLYLVPGLFGAPLPALSALAPPPARTDFVLGGSTPAVAVGDAQTSLCEAPRYAQDLELPLNLPGYFDLQQALRCAREKNKPVFVDFTGHNCGNCRKMEASVWSDPEVLRRLREDYVIVALYVDDKTELPASEWYTSKRDGREKRNLGEQNLDFQISRFGANAQPYYVILSPDGKSLVPPVAYDPDVTHFVNFLDAGLRNYRQQSAPVAAR
ncbi:thioredoxin family protein [Hymenobacter sp. BT175]|uniref:protein-disulfide reductase DsbD family protein n=1 Tax=Hymenobacter translucens TaxID=2886507 RepID=UPI001D0F0AC1|nr:thioredoxin family protein [Hymenobacter translucens]MCC2546887.1 thioredoxin family protein [Hymenobacter translucens]